MEPRSRQAHTSDPTGSVDAVAPQLLAGYRVVRRLGSSVRADVYLGHAGLRDAPGPGGEGRATGVALKVFGAEADPASIEREIRALSETPAGTLPELLDVATLPDARICLVLERLSGPPLARHLGSIDRLEPGEAVTILAPIVTAVSALHEAGFAHEGLNQSTVLFDARGRPVVTGLGALGDLPPAGVARIPALRADYLRIALLARGVFDHLDPVGAAAPAAARLAEWFEHASAEVPFRPCLDELERRLFDWTPATAVRLPGAGRGGDDASAADLASMHLRRDASARGRRGEAAPARPASRRLPGWFAVFHLPPELRQAAAAALDENRVSRGLARLRELGRLRRRPLLLAALLACALVLPALSLLPKSADPVHGAAGSGQADGAPTGTRQAPAPGGSTARLGAGDTAALAGDDPVLAVPALLRVRAGCLARASVICLDGVDQSGSAIMAADGYATRSAQQGGRPGPAVSFDDHAATLVERTGNSALVALTPHPGAAGSAVRPTSVLVVKGEAGWRLREIFDY